MAPLRIIKTLRRLESCISTFPVLRIHLDKIEVVFGDIISNGRDRIVEEVGALKNPTGLLFIVESGFFGYGKGKV